MLLDQVRLLDIPLDTMWGWSALFRSTSFCRLRGLDLRPWPFFLHTALPVRLGPLAWILNTPAHHRVHHSCNEACLDKNYGSVLIVFDHLFGTFAAPPGDEPLRFGLNGRAASSNLIAIALGEWRHLFARCLACKRCSSKVEGAVWRAASQSCLAIKSISKLPVAPSSARRY